MKRFNKNTVAAYNEKPSQSSDHGNGDVSKFKCGSNLMKLMGFLLVSVMGFSVLFSLFVVMRDPPNDDVLSTVAKPMIFYFQSRKALQHTEDEHVLTTNDELLYPGFDEKSCLSRYQSLIYRHGTKHKPSRYLISKLRGYEARHKKCGPITDTYNTTVKNLNSGKHSKSSDCKYIVWISFSGLGNRILTLASTFLYALLTDRVLLIDRGNDMSDLFCEPFPDTSWLLPLDFPLIHQFGSFDKRSNQSYGNLLKSDSSSGLMRSSLRQHFVYLHMVHDYDHHDKLFFCDHEQMHLQKIPWLMLKTDNYFVPSLFLMPSFEKELHKLFPDKETVFHFLGRYLFHPTNSVWGLVCRYYEAYLSKADVKVGIQIRVFDPRPGPFKHILDQILACTSSYNILPHISINQEQPSANSSNPKKTIAVLMTSLSQGYYEEIRDMYWESPTVTGEIVSVYQPSHEEHQQSEKHSHNRKAWAEIYLLSYMDRLVTSSWSTFGYVAQGLGGVRPWILYKPEGETRPDPPCRRAVSMEPCFHAPPFYDCKMRTGVDTSTVVPHVKHCEDMSWGLKLVQDY